MLKLKQSAANLYRIFFKNYICRGTVFQVIQISTAIYECRKDTLGR